MIFKPLWIPFYKFTIETPLNTQQALDNIQAVTTAPMDPFYEFLVAGHYMSTRQKLFWGEVPSHSFSIREHGSPKILINGKPIQNNSTGQSRFQVIFSIEPEYLFHFVNFGICLVWIFYWPLGEWLYALFFVFLCGFVFFGFQIVNNTVKTKKFLIKLLEAK